MQCTHLNHVHKVKPSAKGCEDCLKIGGQWVHLRMCMECGHMGCCDSSPNGPYRVEGPISLIDVNGNEWDLTGKPAISLCRCGLSSKRPFCDGTHGREGWKCEASPIPTEPIALG
jgi:CDGSH-type Zn-finger protein